MNHLFEFFVVFIILWSLIDNFIKSVWLKAYWRKFRIWRLKFLWKQNCKLKVFVDRRGQRWAKKLNDWNAFD